MQEKIDPTLLIQIGEWSLRPVDISSIRWNFASSVEEDSLNTTGTLTSGRSFVLKDSEPNYPQNLEILAFVSNTSNWKPKSDWLLSCDSGSPDRVTFMK